ncbi:unnamed protein product [Rhizophagus irregularis]|uniref:Uncharacterized protein n=1 Tax=Rhizophagus irregularis TaxID=588596 RepID=A0A2N1MPN1_9GLOM|nr:hypothetical protein RhiirC2_788667 [Rhizophagus irregularis]CAB5367293.1 unnamed protein product [Rhizophagus irregularis]
MFLEHKPSDSHGKIDENAIKRVEALLLKEPLDSLCGASAVYLMIENDILPPLEYVREIVDRAINSSLLKIEENE